MPSSARQRELDEAEALEAAAREEARQRELLILNHLWIVRHWAKLKQGRGPSFDELVSIGSFALVHAANKWPGVGNFKNYAFRAIRSAIDRPYSGKNGPMQSLPKAIPAPQRDDLDNLEGDGEISFSADECRMFLTKLPQYEAQALRLNYGIECEERLTAAQIAKRMRTTEDKVYALIQSGLLRLRWLVVQRERVG